MDIVLTALSNTVEDYNKDNKMECNGSCHCGKITFVAQGNLMYFINIRCIEDLDLENIKINHFNGCSI